MVEKLFELTPNNVRHFLKEQISVFSIYLSSARCKFEKMLIQQASCKCKQFLDLLAHPKSILTDRDLEDMVISIHKANKKIHSFIQMEILN